MKFLIIIILMMCALVTVPYMFAEGGIFDVHRTIINECGDEVVMTGYYQTNVTFILIFSFVTTVALAIPFLKPNLHFAWKAISLFLSGWFCSGLVYEIMNLFISDLMMNSAGNYKTYFKYLLSFTLLIVGLQINITWKQNISKN